MLYYTFTGLHKDSFLLQYANTAVLSQFFVKKCHWQYSGRPARVSSGHITWAPCAVERDVRSVPQVRSSNLSRGPERRVRLRKSNYLKIIPMYMMIREIILGRQQRVRRCPL